MWKKDDVKTETTTPATAPAPRPAESSVPGARAVRENALIGRSISIRGDVTGDEDLVIQGRVEGSVNLREHAVTVGGNGEVSANIIGRAVMIEGRVVGNIEGGEQVTLRSSAYVEGDISAPRVVLENGARFRGLVDMGEADESKRRKTSAAAADAKKTAVANGSGPWEAGRAASKETNTTADDSRAGPSSPEAKTANGKGKQREDAEAPLSA
ncbi:MAG: polymer-forming cytoskeletal protein [Gemmatimonadota bacterium]